MIKCRDCVCWVPTNEDGFVGQCRRFAPRAAVNITYEAHDAIWPDTCDEEGCYEGVPKPVVDSNAPIDLRATIDRILAAPCVPILTVRACTVLHNAEIRGDHPTSRDLTRLPNCGDTTAAFIRRFLTPEPTKEG